MEFLTEEEKRLAITLFPVIYPFNDAYETVYKITQMMENLNDLFSPDHYPLGTSPLAADLEHFGHLVARYVREIPAVIRSVQRIYEFISDTLLDDSQPMESRLTTLESNYFSAVEGCDAALMRSSQAAEALSDLKQHITQSLSYPHTLRRLAIYALGPNWCNREITLREAPAVLDELRDLLRRTADVFKEVRFHIEDGRERFSVQALQGLLDMPMEGRQSTEPFMARYLGCLDVWRVKLGHDANLLDVLTRRATESSIAGHY
ncbi:hypothetical protein GGF50DRAFT_119975 [Schizophyllum commune]